MAYTGSPNRRIFGRRIFRLLIVKQFMVSDLWKIESFDSKLQIWCRNNSILCISSDQNLKNRFRGAISNTLRDFSWENTKRSILTWGLIRRIVKGIGKLNLTRKQFFLRMSQIYVNLNWDLKRGNKIGGCCWSSVMIRSIFY